MKQMKKLVLPFIIGIFLLNTTACGGQNNSISLDKQDAESDIALEDTQVSKNNSDSSLEAYLDSLLEANQFDDSITFDQLARYPDEYVGTPIALVGEIVQTIDGEDFTGYRFELNGDYSQTVYVEAYSDYPITSMLEGDYVTLFGVSAGEYTYESVNGSMVTVPAIIAAKMELTEIPLPECPACPIILERDYEYAPLNSTTVIDSFEIYDAEFVYTGMLSITCRIIGTVTGSDFFDINLDCYDSDGFLLDSAFITSSIKDGEPFRICESTYIPANTVKIQISIH